MISNPMLKYLLIILTTFFTFNSYSQTNGGEACQPILVNDSLFQLQSDPYDFDISRGTHVQGIRRDLVSNINILVAIEENCMTFRINYGCGCGDNEKRLVTNGLLLRDNQGRNYYSIKFIFSNYNNGCKALCHDILSYDISELKDSSKTVNLKFDEFEGYIAY
jgi:hypothetical protein